MRSEARIEATLDPTQADARWSVYATCEESGHVVGPILGTGPRSCRRVLALLTEECDCGATFHVDPDDDES